MPPHLLRRSRHYTIPAVFEQVVEEFQARTAMRTPDGQVTFAELNSLANRIGRAILERTRERRPVAVLLPKGLHWIASLFGSMKADVPFAPLEPDRPFSQLQRQILDLNPEMIITDSAGVETANRLGAAPVVVTDGMSATDGEPNLGLEIRRDSLAAIFYTSGSTGQPRGVTVPQQSLVDNALVQVEHFGLRPEDRVMLLTFHPGAVMSALLSGAGIAVLSDHHSGLAGIPERIRCEGITVVHATTSTFRSLAAMAAGPETFASVRLMIMGSETGCDADVSLFRKHFPVDSTLISGYGSAEALGVSFAPLHGAESSERDILSIGRPLPGKEFLILDSERKPIPPGQIGELAVRSRFIASGYWNSPSETSARFLTDPGDPDLRTFLSNDLAELMPDGTVILHGRRDSIVKIRGSLVSLPHVEGVLHGLDGIEEVVVLAVGENDGNPRLVAYLQPASGATWSAEYCREALAASLPAHMIPSVFLRMNDWPRLPSGKIDKLALPKPSGSRAFYTSEPLTPARSCEESAILAIWKDIFHLDELGVHDNFYALGGDSLTAAALAARISRHFLTPVSAARVFECGTVAGIAELLARTPLDEDVERLLTEIEALSPEEVGDLLNNQTLSLGTDSQVDQG